MNVVWNIESVERQADSVLTVGTFDGVHLGHRFILEELNKKARNRGWQSTLVTFRPHPQLVLQSPGKSQVSLLTTTDEKIELLENLGLDRIVVIEFTREFSRLSSEEFVCDILFEKVGFGEMVIGYDHAFGRNREGNYDTLSDLSKKMGFEVDKLPAFEQEGRRISSTYIRNLLKECRIEEANQALGRKYSFVGRVSRGDGRGKELHFPTANLIPDSSDKVVPGDGVYAVYVGYKGQTLKGMMNIGMRPTFGQLKKTIEVHIFDFDQDIYNQEIKIEFVDYLRAEKKFKVAEDLIDQLEKDREISESIL